MVVVFVSVAAEVVAVGVVGGVMDVVVVVVTAVVGSSAFDVVEAEFFIVASSS